MNDAIDQPTVRERLLERLARLRAMDAGSGTDGDVVDLDQQRVGRLSRMDALQAQAMAGETRRRRAAEVRRLEAALAREARGEYGRCLECDAPIPSGRLEVDPAASHCVACAAGQATR
ncbi:MAG TPA: TraR/DksA C4-type zinc finger protein [Pseudomonadales bacterium]|nr:TraR/DksA C4-type zinc finger protein [Pseudomonadales bacterium]